MTMDADECHSGLNLDSQGAVPKLAVKTIGSSNRYLYELSSSNQLFVIKGLLLEWTIYLWYGGLHKNTAEGLVFVMDACVRA